MRLLGAVLMLTFGLHIDAANVPQVKTVFVIAMENSGWPLIEGSSSAPFINHALLPIASYCRNYSSPRGIHPSLPNYLWLEAGTNFGIFDDLDPLWNHQCTSNHLSAQLERAGISWKTYQEDISGTYVPLFVTNNYTPRHNPFVYFDDVTQTNNPASAYAISHIRPYVELAADLTNNTVARYNFITPNVCNDMHDPCAPLFNPVQQGDGWLASAVPAILNSAAYQDNGALFILWDEADGFADGPLGMLLLSPLARAPGYKSNLPFDHSSLLRTLQEIFGVSPFLGDAANATSMWDLFAGLRLENPHTTADGAFHATVTGATPGSTNILQFSSDLLQWHSFITNVADTSSFDVTDPANNDYPSRFYRVQTSAPSAFSSSQRK